MRLLFFIHAMSGGGAERVMAILMNAFAKRGDQVRVVYTARAGESVYELDSRIEQVFLYNECPRVKLEIVNKILYRIWKYPAIRRQAISYQPDFAISFIRETNIHVLTALLGTGITTIVADHTNINVKYSLLTTILSNLLYPTAGAITMLTQEDCNVWKKKYKHVYYIPNPCEIKSPSISKIRNKIVLGVGRVNQWKTKGFDNLILAWSKIREKYPDWKCQIAGFYDEIGLEQLRQFVGVQAFETVEFLGFKSNIHEYMATSEVFCLSSRREGMPMALLEALSLGCACAAYDCQTGPSEMIENGENGLLVNNQDVDDLAQKLDYLISNEELRNKFRKKAPQSVQKFSTRNIIAMWDKMFNELKSSRQ